MRILLCLCDTCLFHAMGSQEFTECIADGYLMESHIFVRDSRVILCEAYIGQIQSLLSCETCKLLITEGSRDLTRPVRTEIKEDDRIFVPDDPYRLAVFYNGCRLYKFVSLLCRIGVLDSAYRALCLLALSLSHNIVGSLHTIPAVVTVHSIVTSHNGCHLANTQLFHLVIELFDIFFSCCGRSVTSVQEAVYKYFGKTFSLSQLQNTIHMGIMAVHTTVRKKSE